MNINFQESDGQVFVEFCCLYLYLNINSLTFPKRTDEGLFFDGKEIKYCPFCGKKHEFHIHKYPKENA